MHYLTSYKSLSMFEKLQSIEKTYLNLQQKMYDPEIATDQKQSREINKQLMNLEESYQLFQIYKKLDSQKKEAEELLANETDADMVALAQEQLRNAVDQIPEIEEKIKVALLPKDPNDDKDIFLEIRPAAGWDEAGLFASELLKWYMLYAQKQWRKTEIIENQYSDIGWVKFVMVKMAWDRVYSKMKFESGVHRVQRIPATESQWRVHTSTITVAIMPEAEDVDVTINPNDVQMDTYAASSSGGQNANKNQTWVRLHHLPSWLIVTIWDSKSQMQNKEKAWAVLKSRIYQIEQDKATATERAARWEQIGTGERSEKIRTYNYPQDRITDHRIKQSRGNIPGVMMGEFDDIINALVIDQQARLLGTKVDTSGGDDEDDE